MREEKINTVSENGVKKSVAWEGEVKIGLCWRGGGWRDRGTDKVRGEN